MYVNFTQLYFKKFSWIKTRFLTFLYVIDFIIITLPNKYICVCEFFFSYVQVVCVLLTYVFYFRITGNNNRSYQDLNFSNDLKDTSSFNLYL